MLCRHLSEEFDPLYHFLGEKSQALHNSPKFKRTNTLTTSSSIDNILT